MGGAKAAGMWMGVMGGIKANMEQSLAEKRNAKYFDEQAQYAEYVGARKLELLTKEQGIFKGRQKAAVARSGVSFGGSILDVLAGQEVDMAKERFAVQSETRETVTATRNQAANARRRAAALSDFGNNLLQAGAQVGGTALTSDGGSSPSPQPDPKNTNSPSPSVFSTAWTNNGSSYGMGE